MYPQSPLVGVRAHTHASKREARFPIKVLENGKLCINVNSCLMIG